MVDLETSEIRGTMIFEGEDYYREVPLILDLVIAESADLRFMNQAGRALAKATQERYRMILEDEDVQNAQLS